MTPLSVGLAEAKTHFSQLTTEVVRTQRPVTVFKNNKPWVVIHPAREVRLPNGRTENIDPVTIAGDIMDEYRDVFEVLAQ